MSLIVLIYWIVIWIFFCMLMILFWSLQTKNLFNGVKNTHSAFTTEWIISHRICVQLWWCSSADWYLKNTVIANVLVEVASRAFGSVWNNVKEMKDLRYQTYTRLYESCVVPIADYGGAVWGYKNYSKPLVLHHKVIRYFLVIHGMLQMKLLKVIWGDYAWAPDWNITNSRIKTTSLVRSLRYSPRCGPKVGSIIKVH